MASIPASAQRSARFVGGTMAKTQYWQRLVWPLLIVTPLAGIPSAPIPAHASAARAQVLIRCAATPSATDSSVVAGRQYLPLAYDALTRDREQLAGLSALKRSQTLSMIAEAHSAYMASIDSWSDGDPEGSILTRVRAAGLDATYAGQNVVTANSATIAGAIQNGEAFFAQEAGIGGPHWDNITNPNHHYVGMGVALLGTPGRYTLYLTQVFSDVGGCNTTSSDPFSTASAVTTLPKVGSVVELGVDYVFLRSEPGGMVVHMLRAGDHLKIFDVQDSWAQVESLDTQLYGWVFVPLLVS
jgi:uncharacterized protein YkwD